MRGKKIAIGGSITLTAGNQVFQQGTGGEIVLSAGEGPIDDFGVGGPGGNIVLNAGAGGRGAITSTTGEGGSFILNAGIAGNDNRGVAGGGLQFTAGSGPTSTQGISLAQGDGGAVSFTTGSVPTIPFATTGNGGNFVITLGAGNGVGSRSGLLIINNVPTSDPGITGAVWKSGNTLMISG